MQTIIPHKPSEHITRTTTSKSIVTVVALARADTIGIVMVAFATAVVEAFTTAVIVAVFVAVAVVVVAVVVAVAVAGVHKEVSFC